MLTIENLNTIAGQQYRDWLITKAEENDRHYVFILDAPNSRIVTVNINRTEKKGMGYPAAVVADGNIPLLIDTYFKLEEMESVRLFTHNLINWLDDNGCQWQGVF
jgi:hypothetical protein